MGSSTLGSSLQRDGSLLPTMTPGDQELPGYSGYSSRQNGHLVPGHLVPGHLVPSHLVPGHLVPGHLVPSHLVSPPSQGPGNLLSDYSLGSDVEDSMLYQGHEDHHHDGHEDVPCVSYEEKRRRMNKKKRVVLKGGMTNVSYKNISKKRRRYFSDLYTTLLDSSWTLLVIMFTTSFYGSWMLFGALYYLILLARGDLSASKEGVPCILETRDFASCFLFSLETQHTIGYGTRQTTTACPEAMLLVSLQSVLGCLIQAFMVGLVFSKLTRPRNRSKTIIFSHQAVVNIRNGKLCLIIRIGDLRDDNFILGTEISAKLLRRRITAEGEMIQEMQSIQVSPDTTTESCIFFVWPLDIVHEINKDSPFYHMSPEDLKKERFELLIIMEGTNEINSMTFQSRSSYLPGEIKWGHRFEQMLLYRKDQNKFQVNFSAFHSMYEVETPMCSARDLDILLLQRKGERKLSQLAAPRALHHLGHHSAAFLPLPPRQASHLSLHRVTPRPPGEEEQLMDREQEAAGRAEEDSPAPYHGLD